MKNRLVHWSVIGIFTLLYFVVSIISTIHVVDFFEMTNPFWLAVSLAVGFELGAAASLASLTVLDKINRPLVWTLFIVLTLFQSMGNMYYAYVYANDYQGWVELFGLMDESAIFQKRILAAISGAILPLVALGYIKSLVDYIKPGEVKKSKKNDVLDDLFKKSTKEAEIAEDEDGDFPEPNEALKNAAEVYKQVINEDVKESEEEQPEQPELPESDELQKTDNDIKTKKSVNKQSKQISERVVSPWPIKTTKINPKEKKK